MRAMILLVTPAARAAPTSVHGNDVTARRWQSILTGLGCDVRVTNGYEPGDYAALIALHARKSADAIRTFHTEHPGAPIVLALTGTDLYPDLVTSGVEREILALASRIVVLQPHALAQLDAEQRARTTVIVQSMPDIPHEIPRHDAFEVAVLAHLRAVKDPLRTAEASRLLPSDSRLVVSHAGAPLDEELARLAREESTRNPRYRWLGEQPRAEALRLLARSKLLVLTSHDEGGANVVSEAIAAGVPVLSSDIPGSRGLLGDDYPGYFPVGDTEALAEALHAAETDRNGYYHRLRAECERRHDLVAPHKERAAWSGVLTALSLPVPRPVAS
ncbi:MAG: TIGR04348 family glycosyltransferase [Actinophytocola sp.]|nr:TIGR04348 family glycosyltransferase [Actinophytocola sp.]